MPALSRCSAQKYIIYINNKSWWILLFRWKKKYCNCDKLCWRQSCTADQPSAAARGCDRWPGPRPGWHPTTSWTQEIKNCKNWPFINISIRSAPVLAIIDKFKLPLKTQNSNSDQIAKGSLQNDDCISDGSTGRLGYHAGGYCEAQGKGRARGGPRKVTEKSFMDGGWWISFPWCFTLTWLPPPSFLPPKVS